MAEKFIKHTGLVVPLDAANVDTDAIIPKQFLQKVTRTGFGAHLFNDWRFLDEKGQQPNPDFVLNFPQYQGLPFCWHEKTSAAVPRVSTRRGH